MTGCAGGLSGGLWAQYDAALEPGAAFVLDALDFDARMRAARAVIVGEGKIDEQTLQGKIAGEIATRARQAGVPCFAIVGTRELDAFGARMLDLQRVLEAGDLDADRGRGRFIGRRPLISTIDGDGALDPLGHPPPEGNHRGVDRPLPRRWRGRGEPRRPALQPLQRPGLGRRARADAAQGPHARALRRGVHAGRPGPGRPTGPRRGRRRGAQRAARAIEGGRAGAIQQASPTVAYVQISTPLENEDAAKQTPKLRKAIGTVPGAKTYLTGYPALNHDTQPIYNKDLSKGESIAVPVAILVMAFMFGTARRDRRAAALRARHDPDHARASCGSSPTTWTWRST